MTLCQSRWIQEGGASAYPSKSDNGQAVGGPAGRFPRAVSDQRVRTRKEEPNSRGGGCPFDQRVEEREKRSNGEEEGAKRQIIQHNQIQLTSHNITHLEKVVGWESEVPPER